MKRFVESPTRCKLGLRVKTLPIWPNALVLAVLLAGLLSCSSPLQGPDTGQPGKGGTSLTITLNDHVNARTLQPSLDMNPAQYSVTGTGPGSKTFTRTTSGAPVTVDDLVFGSWTIVVQAYNSDDVLIGMGQTIAMVNSGQTSNVSVTVTPISGIGTLNLSLGWPADQIQTPRIVSALTPALGSAMPLTFTVGAGTATYSNAAMPNGYYTLAIKLQDSGTTVMGSVEVVRIVAGQTTNGTYVFDNINQNGGTIQVNLTPDMREPLLVSIAGLDAVKPQNQVLNLSGSVSNYGGNLTYVWYVNGDSVATGETWAMGEDYDPGYYRIDLTAFTNDGLRAGSATAQVQVVAGETQPLPLAEGNLLAAGSFHTLSLKADGTAWGSGLNRWGQANPGNIVDQTSPVLFLADVASVSAGEGYSLIVKNDGTLWASGNNTYGRLGDGTTTEHISLEQIMSGVKSVSAGFYHSLAVKTDGTLWGFGYNTYRQLGDGTTIDRHTPVQVMSGVVAAAAGYVHSLVLKSDGSVWLFDNTHGGSPYRVMSGAIAIAAGVQHSMIVKSDGTLWTFGSNYSGSLGDGTTVARNTPVQVMNNVVAVSAGDKFSVALKSDGTVWTFGLNDHGQLGDGTTVDRWSPVQVMTSVRTIAAGYYHTAVVKTDGSLWAFGYNLYGALGDGTTVERHSPVQVSGWLY